MAPLVLRLARMTTVVVARMRAASVLRTMKLMRAVTRQLSARPLRRWRRQQWVHAMAPMWRAMPPVADATGGGGIAWRGWLGCVSPPPS